MSGPKGELPGSPPRRSQVTPPDPPLRTGHNPLADQLIEENSRLRRERNDWMREAERLKRENGRLHDELEEAKLHSIEASNPGIDMDEVRQHRAAEVARCEHEFTSGGVQTWCRFCGCPPRHIDGDADGR